MSIHPDAVWLLAPALVASPLLFGLINRVKALFGGRHGRPLLQTYYDLAKLLRKGAVLSDTTTWMFRAGPVLSVAGPLAALLLLPLAGMPGVFSFSCDFILLAYLLGAARMATMLAALDTGSSFEGMGASREACLGALGEPVLFVTLLAAAGLAGLSELSNAMTLDSIMNAPHHGSLPHVLLALSLFVLLLVENCRIPVDDPNTHLELTMIHEVMILDHSGPDLALITYGSGLKLWIFATLFSGLLLPLDAARPLYSAGLSLGGVFATAVLVGIVESVMARLPIRRLGGLLAGAGACSILALVLLLWRNTQ